MLDCAQICPQRAAQSAVIWAIGALGAWRDGNREEINRRADALRRALAHCPDWRLDSVGAYFAYLRHPFAGPAAAVAERLAAERGVLCLPGSCFGPGAGAASARRLRQYRRRGARRPARPARRPRLKPAAGPGRSGAMALPLDPTTPPMEAESLEAIPEGAGWQYEPKWDGFRCLAFRDGKTVELRSKSGQPLGRYFPDLVAALHEVAAPRFVLDGEIIIPVDGVPSFEELQLRLHPAASRVAKLAAAHPARYCLFDLLADAKRARSHRVAAARSPRRRWRR